VQKEGITQQIPSAIFVLYKTIFAYIPRCHSQPKQIFIKTENSYRATCWNN